MAFQGSLKELPLPDIIQLVSVSGKTGVFVLQSGNQKGDIYLRDGEIVHAVAGDLHGEEAVYELAIWQEGDFSFKPGTTTDQRTIKKSNTNLLMEAARRIDEWQVLSKRIPSTRLVPVFTNQGSSTSVSFTPHEWAVICKIDERRSIEQLAAVLGMSAFEVCKLLYGLVTAGLIELRENHGRSNRSGSISSRLRSRWVSPSGSTSMQRAFWPINRSKQSSIPRPAGRSQR
ncbi:MAG: DUF4388 domain-containing protein [Thermoanaerobaculia bacterium]|nr:DUF4388 domain-containing protein [Thermoanaerobaculia bacterium]